MWSAVEIILLSIYIRGPKIRLIAECNWTIGIVSIIIASMMGVSDSHISREIVASWKESNCEEVGGLE